MSHVSTLPEAKLFTIEALNKVQGFVWPDGTNYAAMDSLKGQVNFYTSMPGLKENDFSIDYVSTFEVCVTSPYPGWKSSLITKGEFDSADGWVRNTDGKPEINSVLLDIKFDAGVICNGICADDYNWVDGYITYWRYHKTDRKEPIFDDVSKSVDSQPVEQNGTAEAETNSIDTKSDESAEMKLTGVKSIEAKYIDQLYEEYRAVSLKYEEALETIAWAKVQREAYLHDIEQWHRERGFEVREIKAPRGESGTQS